MPKVLITGMSGTGKSTVLRILGSRGHRIVDTDYGRWSHEITLPDGSSDWVWREEAVTDLLTGHKKDGLFVAGCMSNQGKFYQRFDHIVLLSAPAEVMLARVMARTDNPYGKRPEEREAILENLRVVEPLLRTTATMEIDTSAPVEQVVRQLEGLASP
ncbi:AAA family ATPase [Nonomuraea sp. NPDC026600]|uniref:AAA family ATPase n=1 Tax=Nonomuraea sp. NPDC026600 TaxID=3155363 RepID=UPI0033F725E4